MDLAEIDLIRSSMAHLLKDCSAAELPARLQTEGWGDLLEDDPAVAVGVLGEQIGRLVAAAPLLDLVLQHAVGLGLDPSSAFVLPPLRRRRSTEMTGASTGRPSRGGEPETSRASTLHDRHAERAGAVDAASRGAAEPRTSPMDLVFDRGSGAADLHVRLVEPVGDRGDVEAANGPWSGELAGANVVVDGLVQAGHGRATRLLVATPEGVVEVGPSALTVAPVAPADPGLQLFSVAGGAPVGRVVAPAAAWTGALASGHRAIAAELAGLAAQMLSDTTTYVLQRQQFGRQIGSFQTVKHRLADVHVALVAARAAMTTAWEDRSDVSSMAAHVLAARAHALASTHCHQVHGGIAFTTEHGFHRFIRRGHIVCGLLGHPDDLVHEIGRRLIAQGRVPRTPQLT
jgi:hypothetical protein